MINVVEWHTIVSKMFYCIELALHISIVATFMKYFRRMRYSEFKLIFNLYTRWNYQLNCQCLFHQIRNFCLRYNLYIILHYLAFYFEIVWNKQNEEKLNEWEKKRMNNKNWHMYVEIMYASRSTTSFFSLFFRIQQKKMLFLFYHCYQHVKPEIWIFQRYIQMYTSCRFFLLLVVDG